MPTTANGLPYPTNSEPLANGAAAVQALAAAVDTFVQPLRGGPLLASGTRLDSLTTAGSYVEPGNAPDRPAAASAVYALVVVFAMGSGANTGLLQLFMSRDASGLFTRTIWNGAASAWKRITLT